MTYYDFIRLPVGSVVRAWSLHEKRYFIYVKYNESEWKNADGSRLHYVGFRNWFGEGGKAELLSDIEILALELR